MGSLFPRLRRRIDWNRWVPIGEGSNPPTTYTETITSARVDGPPNFLDPTAAIQEVEEEEEGLAQLSPPSYGQVRNVTRPEIARLLLDRAPAPSALSAPETDVSRGLIAVASSAENVVTRSNLTDLNDIRHQDVGNHLHLDGRLSAVPNYPVYLETATAPVHAGIPPRRRASRRPASIASANTGTVFLAVAQLPGSEPLDLQPQSDMYRSASSKSSTPLSHLSRSQPSPASSVGVVAAVSGPLQSQPDPFIGQASNVNEISWFWDDRAQEYWKPPDRGYYAPQTRPAFRQTRTRANRPPVAGADQRMSVQLNLPLQRPPSHIEPVTPEIPPTPPPKDPGYIEQQRRLGADGRFRTVRQSRSSPQLRPARDDAERRREIAGFNRPATTTPTGVSSPAPAKRATQIFRFISRSFPRKTLYKGS